MWFYYYRKLINKNYDLYENNELKEVNELSNYYIRDLSRQVYDINKTLNTVKSIINLNSDNWRLIIITNICNINNDEITKDLSKKSNL